MNDLEKKSIECIKNMPIEETTYKVARNVVLDYITNLQQENERLKKQNELLKDQNINEILKKDLEICAKQYKKSDEKLEKYKSRIEKAVEYGNNCLELLKGQENYICESIDIVELLKMIHKNYIDILNGKE